MESEVVHGPRRQRGDPEQFWRNTIRPVGAENRIACEDHDVVVLFGQNPTNVSGEPSRADNVISLPRSPFVGEISSLDLINLGREQQ
jgi:hypothetical protein